MKKFVYLFGALLIFLVPQDIFAGDKTDDSGGIYSDEFIGADHGWKNKDHEKLNFGPIKVGFDVNYLRSTSAYDVDGNKQDNFQGDVYTRLNEILYGRYNGGRFVIGDSKWYWGAGGELSFIQEKWKPGDMNMYGVGYSDNGFTFTPGADIGTRRLGGIRLGSRLGVKYQYDGTKDESNATDKQNALGVTLDFMYKLCHHSKVYVGMNYWDTFAGTQKQITSYDYLTEMPIYSDVDYDQGNQLAIYGGGDYKWCWGDCGWGYAGAQLTYWSKTKQTFGDYTDDKSTANYLSISPEAGFRFKGFPLNISISGSYRNEYGIKQGIIGLSGKNFLKPSIALEGNIRCSF